jgi:hypothetical protein
MWSYLAQHPEIFMARQHELNFFNDDDWRERLDWYSSQFAGASEPVRGEKSVYYTMYPYKPSVADRIREVIPDVKLIYLVRDPVARIVSHYVQAVVQGVEHRPLDEAVAPVGDPANWYLCTSRYASQLREYLRVFAPEQILVIDHADLAADRGAALSRVFGFLGVDETFRPDLDRRMITRERQRKPTAVGWRLSQSAAANAIRRLPDPVGATLAETARRVFYRPVEQRPELDPALEGRLTELLRPEAQELREITGLPLSSWAV